MYWQNSPAYTRNRYNMGYKDKWKYSSVGYFIDPIFTKLVYITGANMYVLISHYEMYAQAFIY